MLRAISFILKLAILSVIVLVLGNWIRWGDNTISDEIRSQMAQAQRSQFLHETKAWTQDLFNDFRKGASRLKETRPALKPRQSSSGQEADPEGILPTERQKLRALIHELNSPKNDD